MITNLRMELFEALEDGVEMEDQDQEDSYGGEFPSRAEIGLIVSEHMRNIFRQLADIDQRLKFIESRVL